MNVIGSKGNQFKWKEDDNWYKADYLGYEALSETIVSSCLQKSNIPSFVTYSVCQKQYKNNDMICCCSKNFLPENKKIVTLQELFLSYKNIDLAVEVCHMEVKDQIEYVVKNVEEITGLTHFGPYLTAMLEIDAFFLNEDRHFNNIAVLYDNEKQTFTYCPIFDNGATLFSDTMLFYPLEFDDLKCKDLVTAKPFSQNFDEQVDMAEELYGSWFQYQFTNKDIEQTLEQIQSQSFYKELIYTRVLNILRQQNNKYRSYQKDTYTKDMSWIKEETKGISPSIYVTNLNDYIKK